MDWSGGDFDQVIREFAARYRELLIDHLAAGADSVWGFGTIVDNDHWAPLALINLEMFAQEDLPAPAALFKLNDAPRYVIEQLPGWMREARPLVLAVLRPEPLAAVGDLIRCPSMTPKMLGTVGPPVTLDGGAAGFLTAGHIAQGIGDDIETVIKGSWLRPNSYAKIGTVLVHQDPISEPKNVGFDVAVVDCSGARVSCGFGHATVAQLSAALTSPLPVTLSGATSGTVNGAIIGSLLAYGDGTRTWKDSWLLTPSGAVTKGDSGAVLVVDSTGEFVGMVMAGSRLPGGSAYAVQYAQDLHSIQANVLTPNKVTLA